MISVVLATFNEQNNIEKCLQSVLSFADEIIVVDGSSTDNTRLIAKKMGARIIKTTNKPNFHINKQMAIDAAQGDLILQLDADEVVDQQLASFIKKTHSQVTATKHQTIENTDTTVAWRINRKNYFLGKWLRKTGQYPDPVIRLFIAGYASLPQKDVHEQMSVSGNTETAEGHLLHFSNPTFSDYLRKFNTYTSFKAHQLQEEKLPLSLWNSIRFILVKPLFTLVSLFFRHKGFLDGTPGFIFSLFSGLHHAVAYLKYWEQQQ